MEVLARLTDESPACASIEDCTALFSSCIKELGYGGFDAFAIQSGSFSNAGQSKNLYVCDYAPEMAWEYFSDGWLQMDPSMKELAQISKPFDYVSFLRNSQSNTSVKWQLSMMRLMNVKHAWLVPLSIFDYIRGVTIYMRGNKPANTDRFHETANEIHLMSVLLMDRLFALHKAATVTDIVAPVEDIAATITARETDCLHWIAQGKTNNEVAGVLGVSENTVRFHLKNVFQKLNAHSRAAAVSEAVRLGVINL